MFEVELFESPVDEILLEEARHNFENLEIAFPVVKNHPFYMIAKAQLDAAMGYTTVAEALNGRKV